MIQPGLSTPQTATINGGGFVAGALVLVTPPGTSSAIPVTPISISGSRIVFEFVFAVAGVYTFVVTDSAGDCDPCQSDPFTLTLTADDTPMVFPDLCEPETLASLRVATQHWLGDDDGAIWSADEIDGYLMQAYQIIATQMPIFWDHAYAENLPRGFSVTQPWEVAHLAVSRRFTYGVANFTAEFERRAIGDARLRYGPANHTSPFEATDGLLGRAGASTDIPATADLSTDLTMLDRVLWDNRSIDALEPRTYSRLDSRYEITKGEVLGYMWQKDGVRTLRKVRVPAAQAETVTVTGSWGLLRTPTDLSATTVTGTWGIARIIDGHHPIGPETFGAPRRAYLDGKNVRVEHFRKGRPLTTDDSECELPKRYARYLMDYARATCFGRPGPGFDPALSAHFDQRWQRGLARIARRVTHVDTEHVSVMGGGGRTSGRRPPRPRLPWAYGSTVR